MKTITIITYIFLILFTLFMLERRRIVGLTLGKKKFKCNNCGGCCNLFVRLTEKDINKIKKAGYKGEYFVEKKDKEKSLKRVNGNCIFLSIDEGKSKCEIQSYKPKLCMNFPAISLFSIKGYDPRCKSFKLPDILR